MSYIDKWDGRLPTVASGDSGAMMLDITSLIDEINTNAANNRGSTPVQTAPTPTEEDDGKEE